MHRFIVCLAAFGVLAACDTPTDTLQSHPTMDPNGSVVAHRSVAASADGMAIRYATLGDGSQLQVKTKFSVKKFADDSVDGWFRYTAGGVELEVDVTCMTVVDGHKAWIAGLISESTIGFEGHVSYFYTYDNGEGADAVDIVSRLRVEATPGTGEDQRFCEELFTILPAVPVDDGNVNIRG